MIVAVVASAMTVLFVLHEETDSASAEVTETGWCGENAYFYIYSDGTLKIEGSGAMFDYNNLQRAPWYDHREDITKIVIGDKITYLGQWAFLKCKYATELTMPITINSVSSDLSCAFAGCYNIEKIHFTCGKDGYGYDYAAYKGYNSWYQNTPWFQSRDALKEITFDDGIIHIGNDAFRELNITKIVLPESVTSLGNHCFFDCTKLTDLTIPVSLNSYGNEDYPAFQGCMAIENVTITRGNGVPFDYHNFWGIKNPELAPWNLNRSIAKTITIADDVTDLGEFMFYETNIKELTIPISADCGYNAFWLTEFGSLEKVTITKGNGRGYDCDKTYDRNPWNNAPNLKTIIVEEGVTHIGNDTFRGSHMETLILPNSLTSFGEYSFKDTVIKYLTIPISLNAVWIDKYLAFACVTGIEKITFTVGTGYGYDYCAYDQVNNCWFKNTPWYLCRTTLKEIVLEDGITHLGSDAFRELRLATVVIPDSVESLGCHTFYRCYYLESLTIPITLDAVASAKYPAFDECEIDNVHFTAGKTGIGYNYYEGYFTPWSYVERTNISHLEFDSDILYIGYDCFYGYTFYGKDGIVTPLAEYLSGNSFNGMNGTMWLIVSEDETAQTSADIPTDAGSSNLTVLAEKTVFVTGLDDRFHCRDALQPGEEIRYL